jgi:GntR family transcriptional regulator, carbon starvation induced regulator
MSESASPTLSLRVLALMRSDILELRLKPGSKLLFETLREKYEVGLSPLRESLSRLVVEGLVVGEDRRGFRVAPMTEEDFCDLTALRQEIEILAVTRSVERGDDVWEADLVRAFHHMKLLTPESPDYLAGWSARHQAFHEALVSACGSPRLLHLRRQLFDQFMRYQRIAPRHISRSAVHDTEHKKLLDAVLARDTKKCEALIRAHIRVLDAILEAIRALNSKP